MTPESNCESSPVERSALIGKAQHSCFTVLNLRRQHYRTLSHRRLGDLAAVVMEYVGIGLNERHIHDGSKIPQSEAFRPPEPNLPLRNFRRGADPMRAYDCKVLLCATAIIGACVSSGTEARYWRHYGYHWYGRSWNGSRPNSNERLVESQLPRTQPGNEPHNQSDFSGGIEEMIHACEVQVHELRNMPLDGVAEMVKPTEQQRDALEQIRAAARNASEAPSSECPKNLPASVPERLDTLSRTLGVMAASLAALRPTFARFYDLLNDEQKARLVAKTVSTQPATVGRQISLTPKSRYGRPARRFLLPAMALVSEKLARQAD